MRFGVCNETITHHPATSTAGTRQLCRYSNPTCSRLQEVAAMSASLAPSACTRNRYCAAGGHARLAVSIEIPPAGRLRWMQVARRGGWGAATSRSIQLPCSGGCERPQRRRPRGDAAIADRQRPWLACGCRALRLILIERSISPPPLGEPAQRQTAQVVSPLQHVAGGCSARFQCCDMQSYVQHMLPVKNAQVAITQRCGSGVVVARR